MKNFYISIFSWRGRVELVSNNVKFKFNHPTFNVHVFL